MNGIISFDKPVTSYDTTNWPNSTYNLSASFVAAFWTDVNGFFIGSVKQRQSTDSVELNDAQKVVINSRPVHKFKANMLYLAEWSDISPCDCYFPVSIF